MRRTRRCCDRGTLGSEFVAGFEVADPATGLVGNYFVVDVFTIGVGDGHMPVDGAGGRVSPVDDEPLAIDLRFHGSMGRRAR